METEKRLERLETKMDSLKDDIGDLKVDFKIHMALVEEHVTGDKKIITEIQPLIQEFKYKKERNQRITNALKLGSVVMSILVGIAGFVLGKVTLS